MIHGLQRWGLGKMGECAIYSNSKLTKIYTTRYNYNCRAWHMTKGKLQK